MDEKIKELLSIIKNFDYKTWRIISEQIENEYKRLSNKSVPEDTKTLLLNIMQAYYYRNLEEE